MSDLTIKLSFVDFDQQGEPAPVGSVEQRTKRRLVPVLYDGDEWLGPVWKRNERGDLEIIDHVELTRMHSYATKAVQSDEVTTERLSAEEGSTWYFFDSNGTKRVVPTLEDGTCLRDIPFT
jgi:hypothetical protein